LRRWRTHQLDEGPSAPRFESVVEGQVSGDHVEVVRGKIRERIALSGPLHSEIALLVHPENLAAVAESGITLLEGGASIRQDVRVRRDPATDVVVDGVATKAWLMTGRALLPMHTLLDDRGRALCRTTFTTSLILQEETV
jgi:hypothetical protein